MVAPSIALISHPEVELIDSTSALEGRPFPGLAVQNETALGSVHYPSAPIASNAHRCEWPTYFSHLVQDGSVLSFVGLNIQDHLANIGHPPGAS